MTTDREAFLAGERPTDVHIYLSEDAVSDLGALEPHGERVGDGIVLVLDGEQARDVFQRTTGIDPMAFAQRAMGTEGTVDPDCTGGTCPSAEAGDDQDSDERDDAGGDEDEPHDARFVFAFAEEQNEEVGGLYAEGAVVHAYVACSCGERYADKWVADDR